VEAGLLSLKFRNNSVSFLLGNSPASELYMPTFRNILSAPSSYAYEDRTESVQKRRHMKELLRRKHKTFRTRQNFEIENVERNLYIFPSPRLLTFPLVHIRFFSWLGCIQVFNWECLYRFLSIVIVSTLVRETGTGCSSIPTIASTKILKLVASGICLHHETSVANIGYIWFQNCVAKMKPLH
jgi:hypothetical protein